MKTNVYYNKKYNKSEILDLISLSFDRVRNGLLDHNFSNKSYTELKSIELSHLFEMALIVELSKLLYGDNND